ncbi:hypothetical protein DPMN_108225 [Dreissena polymorpha]|uniref:Uncharacterized protein n=1 Tax=Dreissena polymorpha TaxID=45954 RepID=A0A9D4K849_DREPO|nr:hypothetical protein DPMN_108225 [Dreissena polymorpha]
MPTRVPGKCRWRPGRAPVYRCTVAIPELCQNSPGHHRRQPMRCRSSAEVCMRPVELRCRPGCSRCRSGCSRCCAGHCRSFPVTPGGIKHFDTFPVESRFIPIEPRFILDHAPGLYRHHSETGPLLLSVIPSVTLLLQFLIAPSIFYRSLTYLA